MSVSEEFKSPAVSALRRAIVEIKQRCSVIGLANIYYLKLLSATKGTLSRWSRLHLQSLEPINTDCARVVCYGPFSL
jgi:hypothetical protein